MTLTDAIVQAGNGYSISNSDLGFQNLVPIGTQPDGATLRFRLSGTANPDYAFNYLDSTRQDWFAVGLDPNPAASVITNPVLEAQFSEPDQTPAVDIPPLPPVGENQVN